MMVTEDEQKAKQNRWRRKVLLRRRRLGQRGQVEELPQPAAEGDVTKVSDRVLRIRESASCARERAREKVRKLKRENEELERQVQRLFDENEELDREILHLKALFEKGTKGSFATPRYPHR